jgi:hypothetical protein
MKPLTDKIFIEDQYPGVTLGAIALPHGLIQIDAPPSQDDGRSWRASLMNLSSGVERILINLDSHFDRTLGARLMDCPIIAHEKIAEAYRTRPNSVKSQVEETGSDWESVLGIGNVRWTPPEITFTGNMTINWNDTTILIEQHGGPSIGACWVIIPSEKVVFVGDLALKNQPPFFATADLQEWIVSLQHLVENYQNYKIVSGRGGLVSMSEVQHQLEMMQEIELEFSKASSKQSVSDITEKLTQIVLSKCTISNRNKKQFELRLGYGIKQYLSKNFRSGSSHS